jgi:hypothetical protein
MHGSMNIMLRQFFFKFYHHFLGDVNWEAYLGFVVPCIFKYSIKHPTRRSINLIFIALPRRHRSTSYGNQRLQRQLDGAPDDGHNSTRNMLSGVYATKQ